MKWRIGGMEGVHGGSMFNDDAADLDPSQADVTEGKHEVDVSEPGLPSKPQAPTETDASNDEPYLLPGVHLGILVEGERVDFSNMYGGD